MLCISLQNGPDRDRCVAALTSELDNANSVTSASAATAPPSSSSSAPSMRRYSLQGRHRLRRHSLVSSSGVSSMESSNQRRRRNSCVALTNQGRFRETGCCDLEVSGSSPAVPMVVLTPESPSAVSQVTTLFSPDSGGCNEQIGTADNGRRMEGNGSNGRTMEGNKSGGFFIMGNSSNLTATCLDIDEEDLLNNNNNKNVSGGDHNTAAAGSLPETSEDDDGSGSSSGFSLSTATLSHGELRLMQLDSAAPVATTAFTRIRDKHVAFYCCSPEVYALTHMYANAA